MVLRKGRTPAASAALPGYKDLQEIGGGAFATVFRAVEVETGRPVALKILKVDTVHAHLIETFTQEIQALAAVSDHPNIVTLYRPSTTTDGRPVLVLELCRESLGQQLRTRGPLDPIDVTRIGIKIAGALETAHRNGFLHRDMKPQNILITQFGEPALADFGVAALQASAQMTAGVFGFTTLHAAPEVLEGHHLSPATDVYGLASTMYQLLTGGAPFATFENEAPASVILRILRDPVRPLRAENIPLTLADLLEAALSKTPDGRPRTAADFAVALQGVEREQGWPETGFVAWGEEGGAPPVSAGRGPMGVFATLPGLLPAAGAGSALPDPSGVAAAAPAPAGSARPTAPAPPAAGAPVGGDPVSGGERPPLPPEVPQAGPADPYGRRGLPPLLPPSSATPPAAPLPPVRPSLAIPEAAERRVVAPTDAVRGRPASPPARPGATPAPPAAGSAPTAAPVAPAPVAPPAPVAASAPRPPSAPPPPAGEGPARPVDRPRFADPEPSDRPVQTSVYEETMGVHQLLERERSGPAAAPAPRPGRRSYPVPLWAVAALVVAALVIVAAALLLAGVI